MRSAGRLHFTSDVGPRTQAEDLVLFIAVGTPTGDDGSADLSASFRLLPRKRGSAARDVRWLPDHRREIDCPCRHLQARPCRLGQPPASDCFAVVSNPEFLREGWAITDFMHPDRIVFGCTSARALMAMRRLYAPLTGSATLFLRRRRSKPPN